MALPVSCRSSRNLDRKENSARGLITRTNNKATFPDSGMTEMKIKVHVMLTYDVVMISSNDVGLSCHIVERVDHGVYACIALTTHEDARAGAAVRKHHITAQQYESARSLSCRSCVVWTRKHSTCVIITHGWCAVLRQQSQSTRCYAFICQHGRRSCYNVIFDLNKIVVDAGNGWKW